MSNIRLSKIKTPIKMLLFVIAFTVSIIYLCFSTQEKACVNAEPIDLFTQTEIDIQKINKNADSIPSGLSDMRPSINEEMSPLDNTYMVFSIVVFLGLLIIVVFSVKLSKKNKIITQEKMKLEEVLRLTLELEQERQYREIHFGMYDQVIEIDLSSNQINYISNSDELLSMGMKNGQSYDEFISFASKNMISREFLGIFAAKANRTYLLDNFNIKGIDYDEFEVSSRRKGSDTHEWMNIKIKLYISHVSKHIKAVMYIANISNEKKFQLDLQTKAQRDSLTGLYNKNYTQKLADEMLKAKKKPTAVIMIDLDNFKAINDNFGHAYGDGVIIEAAKTITKIFRETDIVGRIGGDEYVVVMQNYGNKGVIISKMDKLISSLHKNYTVNDVTVSISASIGISLKRCENDDYDTLIQNADKALYDSKNQGKNQFVFYK